MTTTGPRPFRVHTANGPQDCVLHPDGRLTMQVADAILVNALGFEEMLEQGWADCRIDWDPGNEAAVPLPAFEPEPEPEQPDLFASPRGPHPRNCPCWICSPRAAA